MYLYWVYRGQRCLTHAPFRSLSAALEFRRTYLALNPHCIQSIVDILEVPCNLVLDTEDADE
jgi:hypothetical protein